MLIFLRFMIILAYAVRRYCLVMVASTYIYFTYISDSEFKQCTQVKCILTFLIAIFKLIRIPKMVLISSERNSHTVFVSGGL